MLKVKNAVLDGEIVCLDSEGRSIFNDLLHRKGFPVFYAVPRAYSDVGTRPDSHTSSDFPATYSLAKSFSERHE